DCVGRLAREASAAAAPNWRRETSGGRGQCHVQVGTDANTGEPRPERHRLRRGLVPAVSAPRQDALRQRRVGKCRAGGGDDGGRDNRGGEDRTASCFIPWRGVHVALLSRGTSSPYRRKRTHYVVTFRVTAV